jgi:hypothetical protein
MLPLASRSQPYDESCKFSGNSRAERLGETRLDEGHRGSLSPARVRRPPDVGSDDHCQPAVGTGAQRPKLEPSRSSTRTRRDECCENELIGGRTCSALEAGSPARREVDAVRDPKATPGHLDLGPSGGPSGRHMAIQQCHLRGSLSCLLLRSISSMRSSWSWHSRKVRLRWR